MTMDDQGLSFLFKSGSTIKAPINNHTNLPQIPLSDAPALTPSTFGFDTFSFEAELLSDWNASLSQHNAYMNVLRTNNTNLRASQKELLLWHQRLSHYNLPAIRSFYYHELELSPTSQIIQPCTLTASSMMLLPMLTLPPLNAAPAS
jgi:hypothetical protein